MLFEIKTKVLFFVHIPFVEYHLFQLLKRFDAQNLPLDIFLSKYFKAHPALGSKDRQHIARAAYGMSRWKSLLDYLVGAYPTWEQRYACFRDFQPIYYLNHSAIPLHIRLSFPEELFSLIREEYGEDKTLPLCLECNNEAPLTIRINSLKTTREKMLKRWDTHFNPTPCLQASHGIQFPKRIALTALSEFKEGLFEIQDEASQLVSALVDAKPGQQILDYCAGAGGKTLAFAPQMHNQGQIYLHDVRTYILEQAKKRLRRAGIQNAQFLHETHPALSKLKKKMDWVLVDVPCSGSGTLRRNPDQKWKFSIELLQRLMGQQRMIFEKALSFVKPGGKIVYATCSLLSAENNTQVMHFLQTYDLELEKTPFSSLPTFGGMDGFFAAVFKKS